MQRYMGHASPEMTIHYTATLPQTHEREFLRMAKVNRDGRPVGLDPRDIYDLVQLDKRTDRILPNRLCLLPPRQVCNRGNACLTCDQFATDSSYLPEHEQQLGKLVDLIEQRQTLFQARTGQTMSEDNVWLEVRRREQRALNLIITALEDPSLSDTAKNVRGAGTRRTPAKRAERNGRRLMARGNPENLRAAARRKSENATQRADLAIRSLVKQGEPITFRGVARTAGCSIDFLYNSPDLRPRIEHLRAQQQGAPPPRAVEDAGLTSGSSIVRTLTAQLTEPKQRHHRETQQLKAALAAAQGEILALKRQCGQSRT